VRTKKLKDSETQLGTRLDKSLSAYAVAAAAAGVSLLASTVPANAKIVYTPTNIPIPVNGGWVAVDLNHDGIADFSFSNWYYNWGEHGSVASLAQVAPKGQNNAVWAKGSFGFGFISFYGLFAPALHPGFTVGPNKDYFQKGKDGLLGFCGGSFYGSRTDGQWLYTQRRYLGLRLLIDGQLHYGWARLNVARPQHGGIQATLTGYAYETIPNKPIITGKTKGPDVVTMEPVSLGRLSQGANGISAWRGRK
jgi:hypothetical protein